MRTFKKVLMLALEVLLIFSSAACRKNQEKPPVDISDYTYLYKYPETLPISVGQFIASQYPAGETYSNNVMYKMALDIMNIKFEPMMAANYTSGAYMEQIGMSINANNIPDLFMCSIDQVYQLAKYDMITDLTDIFEEYASPKLKHLLKYINSDLEETDASPYEENILIKGNSVNGRLYALPWVIDKNNNVPLLYIRKDWRESIGAELPTTADEVIELAIEFKEKAGNGTIPENAVPFVPGMDQGIYYMYGGYPSVYLKDDQGNYIYGAQQESVKDGLWAYNRLYQNQAMDPNYGTNNTTVVDYIKDGRAGMTIGEFWTCSVNSSMDSSVMNPAINAEWEVVPLPGKDGGLAKPYVPINQMAHFVVRKGFQNPEALVVIMNHIVEGFFEGGDDNPWTKGVNEFTRQDRYKNFAITNWIPVRTDNPGSTKTKGAVKKAVETGDLSALSEAQKIDAERTIAYRNGEAPEYWYYEFMNFYTIPAVDMYNTQGKGFQMSAFYGSPPAVMTEKSAFYVPEQTKRFNEIILYEGLTREKLDEMFADFIQDQNENRGMKEVLDELNRNY